ncbi:MAG TPA: methyltransferase domain-containing protein [Polyangia bacterium]|nr:methyltransferase domain-containing protein [Polyangia bacterium]
MAESPSDPQFWRDHYAAPSQGWEIGRAAPPLASWFVTHPSAAAGKRALVIGCGRGHEARMLAAAGADVVAIDFAPEAIAEARLLAAKEGVGVDFRVRDLFALGSERERFELVLEHCCFCAIDPARRQEYVERVAGALVDGGQYVGLLRTRCNKPEGPPFSVSPEEVERLFGPRFVIDEARVPDDSIEARRGNELFVRMTRR